MPPYSWREIQVLVFITMKAPRHHTCLPWLQTGDRVTVTNGAHKGQQGIVVKVEGKMCHVYNNATQTEMQVFSRDCTDAAAAEVALGHEK